MKFGVFRINQAWHCCLWHSILDCVSRDVVNKIAFSRNSESRCRQALSKYFRSSFHTMKPIKYKRKWTRRREKMGQGCKRKAHRPDDKKGGMLR